MAKAIAQTYNIANDYRAHITATIFGLCAFLAILYGVNIYKTVFATIALENTEKQVASLSSTVGSLDTQYLSISRAATPSNLKTYGLSQGKVSAYISSPASLGSVALSGHEL
ncbi:MAG: hypothetical protein WCO48_01915 [Candidatus Taylorbacteria bacterium]